MRRLGPLVLLLGGCYDLDALTWGAAPDHGVEPGDAGDAGGGSTGPVLSLFAGAVGGPGSADGPPGEARLDAPYGLVSANGLVYVLDRGSSTVATFDPGSRKLTRIAGSPYRSGGSGGAPGVSRVAQPTMGYFDGEALYFTDTSNDQIWKLDTTSNELAVSFSTSGAGLFGITADGASGFVTEQYANLLATYDLAGTVKPIMASVALNAPTGIAFGANPIGDELVIADSGAGVLRRYDLGTAITTLSGGTWQTPLGVAASSAAGVYYVTDFAAHTLSQVQVTSKSVSTVTTLAGQTSMSGSTDGMTGLLDQPTGIVELGSSVLVSDSGNHELRSFVSGTGLATLTGLDEHAGNVDGSGGNARFHNPTGLAVQGSTTYIADSGNFAIRRVDATGDVSFVADTSNVTDCTGKIVASFPVALAVNGDASKLYFVDSYEVAIVMVDLTHPTPVLTMLCDGQAPLGNLGAIAGSGRYAPPQALALSGTDLYIADSGNDAIKHFDLSGAVPTFDKTLAIGGSLPAGCGGHAGLQDPEGLAIDPATQTLYVASNACLVSAFSIGSGEMTMLAGSARGSADGKGEDASFDHPTALAFDGQQLYVTDFNNSTIRAIAADATVTTYAGIVDQMTNVLGPLRDGTGALSARINRPGGLAWAPGVGLLVASTPEHALLRVQ